MSESEGSDRSYGEILVGIFLDYLHEKRIDPQNTEELKNAIHDFCRDRLEVVAPASLDRNIEIMREFIGEINNIFQFNDGNTIKPEEFSKNVCVIDSNDNMARIIPAFQFGNFDPKDTNLKKVYVRESPFFRDFLDFAFNFGADLNNQVSLYTVFDAFLVLNSGIGPDNVDVLTKDINNFIIDNNPLFGDSIPQLEYYHALNFEVVPIDVQDPKSGSQMIYNSNRFNLEPNVESHNLFTWLLNLLTQIFGKNQNINQQISEITSKISNSDFDEDKIAEICNHIDTICYYSENQIGEKLIKQILLTDKFNKSFSDGNNLDIASVNHVLCHFDELNTAKQTSFLKQLGSCIENNPQQLSNIEPSEIVELSKRLETATNDIIENFANGSMYTPVLQLLIVIQEKISTTVHSPSQETFQQTSLSRSTVEPPLDTSQSMPTIMPDISQQSSLSELTVDPQQNPRKVVDPNNDKAYLDDAGKKFEEELEDIEDIFD